MEKQQQIQLNKQKMSDELYAQKAQIQQGTNVLIFLGDTGHGKSSIIKMLVQEDQKNSIQCSSAISSVTKKISYYKIGTSAKKRMGLQESQKIAIIDTPGLNKSQDDIFSGYKASQFLTEQIYKRKLNLIGIIYVLSLNHIRILDQSGNNRFLDFYQMFPISLNRKLQLSFTVFTHYDKIQQPEKFVPKKLKIFYQGLKQFKKPFSEKNLCWMSSPSDIEQQQLFDEKIQQKGLLHLFYKNQWSQLCQKIKQNLKQQRKITPFELEKAHKDFENNIFAKLEQQFNSIDKNESSPQEIKYYIKPNQLNNNLIFTEKLGRSFVILGSVTALGMAAAAVGTGGISVALGAAFFFVGDYIKKKQITQHISNWFKKKQITQHISNWFKKKSEQEFKIQKTYQKMAEKELKQIALIICEKKIASQFKTNGLTCYLKKFKWIIDVEIQYQKQESQEKKDGFFSRIGQFLSGSKSKQSNQKQIANICKKNFENEEKETQYFSFVIPYNIAFYLKLNLRIPGDKVITEIVKKTGKQMFYSLQQS